MKILLLGKEGQVGWELQRALLSIGTLVACNRQEASLDDIEKLRQLIHETQPDIIVNAAAYTSVDKAESEPEIAYRINAHAVAVLAAEAFRLNAWLVHYSTDYVFDGTSAYPYKEDDAPIPLSVYGKSKWEGEQSIRTSGAKHLIFRTSWVYGAHGKNFVKTILKLAESTEEIKVVSDQHGAPTSAELIADVTALVLFHVKENIIDAEKYVGTYHLTAGGATTWYEYATYILQIAQQSRRDSKTCNRAVVRIPAKAYKRAATRPKNSVLNTEKITATFGVCLPDWRLQVERMLYEIE